MTLGATATADALLLSLTVLTLFDVVFVSGAAILTAQAIYVRRHARNSERLAIAGLARSAALWVWFGLTFGAACAVAGDPLAALIAPGFTAETRGVFLRCCQIACLLPAASALMVFASALNRINGREVLFTVNPLVINGLSWAAIVIAAARGGSSLATVEWFLGSVVAATAVMFGWQLRCLEPAQRRRLVAHFRRALSPRHLPRRWALHRRELRLVGPIVGALLIQQMITLISYAFATRAGSGVLLLFGLAERLTNVIFAVFIMTFLTVLEPRWARAAVTPGGANEIAGDIAVICAALIPLTATLMFAGDSLAMLLFGHGAVGAAYVSQLAEITRIYALTLPGLSMGVVLARLLVIENRGARIFVVNVCVTVLHLGLCAALFAMWGARGVAAALAASLTLQAALYGAYFVGTDNARARGGALPLLARLVVLGALVAAVAWGCSLVAWPSLLRLLLVAVASLLATIGGARLVGLNLLESVRRLAKL